MPLKYISVVEIKSATTKTNKVYPYIIDQDGERWNLFDCPIKPEINRGYALRFEVEGEYRNVKGLEPVINKFKELVLKELASRNDIKRDYSISVSYAVNMACNGIIEPDKIFEWADKIYDATQRKADAIIGELQNDAKDIKIG